LALHPLAALAGTIRVPKDAPTIQAAIDAAVVGDTVLVSPGTYAGFGNRDIRLWGKAITVRSLAGPTETVIDAEGSASASHRGFFLAHNEPPGAVIEGFTIINGYVTGDTGGSGPLGGGGGGAFYIYNSRPTIRACIMSSNTSVSIGQPLVRDGVGGAVYIDDNSSPSIEQCYFTSNHADSGGAIYVGYASSRPTIKSCLIAHNEAHNGGAIRNAHAMSAILNCTIVDNVALSFGGAIVNEDGTLELFNSIIWSNNAPLGPQIFLEGQVMTVAYSAVQGGRIEIAGCCDQVLFWGPGNIVYDPEFINPQELNYRLTTTSPCGNSGDPKLIPRLNEMDLDGIPRLQHCRVDMGAYESPSAVDCNHNGLSDSCELAGSVITDCDENLVPDECESPDCNANANPDLCDLIQSTSEDCNRNDIPDECDISSGHSFDDLPLAGDGIPDECQGDCNQNGVPDPSDVMNGSSQDCNENSTPDECEPPWIVASLPADGSIDARDPIIDENGSTVGWNYITLTFCGNTASIAADQFDVVTSDSKIQLSIDRIKIDGYRVTLDFVEHIPIGACTTIRHVPSETSVSLGYLPADVTGTGLVSQVDLIRLIEYLNGTAAVPPEDWQCDIDHSGLCDPLDILRLIDLLNGANSQHPWLGEQLPECP
jgi:hypothetical protein